MPLKSSFLQPWTLGICSWCFLTGRTPRTASRTFTVSESVLRLEEYSRILNWFFSPEYLYRVGIVNFYFLFYFFVLAIKPGALCILDKCSTLKLHSYPIVKLKWLKKIVTIISLKCNFIWKWLWGIVCKFVSWGQALEPDHLCVVINTTVCQLWPWTNDFSFGVSVFYWLVRTKLYLCQKTVVSKYFEKTYLVAYVKLLRHLRCTFPWPAHGDHNKESHHLRCFPLCNKKMMETVTISAQVNILVHEAYKYINRTQWLSDFAAIRQPHLDGLINQGAMWETRQGANRTRNK